MTIMFDVDTITEEFWAMINRLNYTLEPRHMAYQLTTRLRENFQDQADEAMRTQAVAGGSAWAPLSEWRVRDRGGSRRPMLYDTGSLWDDEIKLYRGTVRLINAGFSFNFPDLKEMTGHAWGVLAGQLVNPLGAAPLAATPRPVFGGRSRQERDAIRSLVSYFRAEGWMVEIG